MEADPLPGELQWGEVLISIRYAPINPADIYSIQTGGAYGQEFVDPPFVAGHDGALPCPLHCKCIGVAAMSTCLRLNVTFMFTAGIAVVMKVGPGVKSLHENDWVIPGKPHLGTWRSLAGEARPCHSTISLPASLHMV